MRTIMGSRHGSASRASDAFLLRQTVPLSLPPFRSVGLRVLGPEQAFHCLLVYAQEPCSAPDDAAAVITRRHLHLLPGEEPSELSLDCGRKVERAQMVK